MNIYYTLFVFFASICIFISFKVKKTSVPGGYLTFLGLGLVLTVIGSFLVYGVYGYSRLIECITLNDVTVAGKPILMGYIFLLLALIAYFDKIVNLNRRNKR